MFRIVLLASAIAAGASLADPKNPTYDEDVKPVLTQHCLGCHSADKQKGGLDLSTFSAVKAGGSSGDVLKPGDPDKSRLYALTAHTEEPKMPPKADRIPEAQLAVLKLWVEQGGRENAGSKVAMAKPKADLTLKAAARGKPDGPPPMPHLSKLPLDPVLVARRPNAAVALAASPWAPLVAVGGQRQIVLSHADTGTVLGVLPFEHGQINSVKFSRNGKLLLAAGGRGGASGKAVLYNVETGEKLTEVGSAETDAILAADLSADQSLIAVGNPTRMVRVYSTADGSVVHAIKKHTDWVTAVEFSPDGVLLASGDRNGGLFVWEAGTGREFYTLRGHTAAIADVSWRADSNVLASASEDGTLRLWEMENGGQIKNWKPHGGGVAAVCYAMDGRIATAGRDRLAKLWDGNGGLQKQLAEPLPDLGLKVAVTHDSGKVIVGDWSGQVRSWAAADGKAVARFDANPPPLPARVQQAEQAVAAAEAKVKQTADALAAAQANAAKAAADLAAGQKAAQDGASAAAGTKAAADAAKADADRLAAAAAAAQKALTDRTAAANADADKHAAALAQTKAEEGAKAAAATAEAEKLAAARAAVGPAANHPDRSAADAKAGAELDAAHAKVAAATAAANAAADQAQADLAAARKAATDTAVAAKAAADKHAVAAKVAGDAAAAKAAADAKVPPLQQAAKAATDAVPPAQGQAASAAAELAVAKARLDQTRELAAAVGK